MTSCTDVIELDSSDEDKPKQVIVQGPIDVEEYKPDVVCVEEAELQSSQTSLKIVIQQNNIPSSNPNTKITIEFDKSSPTNIHSVTSDLNRNTIQPDSFCYYKKPPSHREITEDKVTYKTIDKRRTQKLPRKLGKFIKSCLKCDNSRVIQQAIITLRNSYRNVDKSYVKSKEFKDLLLGQRDQAKSDPDQLFRHIKEVKSALDAHHKTIKRPHDARDETNKGKKFKCPNNTAESYDTTRVLDLVNGHVTPAQVTLIDSTHSKTEHDMNKVENDVTLTADVTENIDEQGSHVLKQGEPAPSSQCMSTQCQSLGDEDYVKDISNSDGKLLRAVGASSWACLSPLEEARQAEVAALESQLQTLSNQIQAMEEMEVDLDDEFSPYVLVEKYKRMMLKAYHDLNALRGEHQPARLPEVSLHAPAGRPAGPARHLQAWLNRPPPALSDLVSHQPFPDFPTVLECTRQGLLEDGLVWPEHKLLSEARELFMQCGRQLQSQRQKREWRAVAELLTDPALEPDLDPVLQERLRQNDIIARRNEQSILNAFVSKQMESRKNIEVIEIEDDEILSEDEDESHEEYRQPAAAQPVVKLERLGQSSNELADRNGLRKHNEQTSKTVQIVSLSQCALALEDQETTTKELKMMIITPLDQAAWVDDRKTMPFSEDENTKYYLQALSESPIIDSNKSDILKKPDDNDKLKFTKTNAVWLQKGPGTRIFSKIIFEDDDEVQHSECNTSSKVQHSDSNTSTKAQHLDDSLPDTLSDTKESEAISLLEDEFGSTKQNGPVISLSKDTTKPDEIELLKKQDTNSSNTNEVTLLDAHCNHKNNKSEAISLLEDETGSNKQNDAVISLLEDITKSDKTDIINLLEDDKESIHRVKRSEKSVKSDHEDVVECISLLEEEEGRERDVESILRGLGRGGERYRLSIYTRDSRRRRRALRRFQLQRRLRLARVAGVQAERATGSPCTPETLDRELSSDLSSSDIDD